MISLLCGFLFCLSANAQSVSQLESRLQSRPDDIRVRLKLANLYSKENNHDKVIALLNPYTDQMPQNGFLVLSSSYASKKDFANEVRILNALVSKDEENYRWHMLLAQAYLKQASETTSLERNAELLTSGIQRLRRTLQLQRTYKPAFDLLLNTLLQQKDHNEARELLMEGIERFGRRPELYRELCRLDSQDGFLVQAVTHCSESIKISPAFPDHYVYLTQAYYDQKEEVKAEKTIVKAAKRFRKSEFVQWAAGELFRRKKNHPVAARYFKAASAADPSSSRAQFGLAQAMFESGQEAEALDFYIKACAADPKTRDAFLFSAGRLKQKGSALGQKYAAAAENCR